MSIKASEISDLIGQRIQNFEGATEARNVGSVMSVADGVVRIHGLADARYGEMLEFPGNIFGLALNLEQDSAQPSPGSGWGRCGLPTRAAGPGRGSG